MTVTKHEILTVGTRGKSPENIIDAMHELPADAEFVAAEEHELASFEDRRVLADIVFTFRREVPDA